MSARAITRAAALSNVSGAKTTPQLIGQWLNGRAHHTRRAYLADLEWWRGQWGALDVRRVTVQAIVDVMSVDHGVKPATMERRLATLRSLLSYAHRTGFHRADVGAAVRSPPRGSDLPERILDPDQIAALTAAASATRNPERDRLIVRLLYLTGARVAEIVGIDWKHVRKRGDRAIVTVTGKGSKTRSIAVPAKLASELREARERAGGRRARGAVFRSRTGKRLDARDVQRLIKRLATRAGVPVLVSPHWLRHSHATHASERGAPLHVIQATLGHANVATTSRYQHASPTQSSGDWLS